MKTSAQIDGRNCVRKRREEVGTLEIGTGNSPDGNKAPYLRRDGSRWEQKLRTETVGMSRSGTLRQKTV